MLRLLPFRHSACRLHPVRRGLSGRCRAATGLTAVIACLAGAAIAQTVDSRTARGLLFSERGNAVVVADVGFLGAAERKAVEDYAGQFSYFAALAVSPGDPASTGSAVAVANHHSPRSAQAAALAGCNARRTTGGPCVVVATVVPRGYRAQPVTLSLEATAAFRKEYRRLDSPKAMAISPATGAFGVARGDGGRAVAACNARAEAKGTQDCTVIIAD